jgi:hypothetical protein
MPPRRTILKYSALLGLLTLLLGGAVFMSSHYLGIWDCPGCTSPELAKAISDARTALLQSIVGIAGAGALYFTWQNYRLGLEGRKSDNFIKAVDQLGHSTVSTRVGGIYGLGRLLRTADVEGDYWPLMDVLTAFLREAMPIKDSPRSGKPTEDLQAAINVLARRSHLSWPERDGDSPVDISQSDLSGLWMAGGHYENGYFGDSFFVKTDCNKAHFQNSILDGADFTEANFERAELRRSVVRSVKGASRANFRFADLRYVDFRESDLRGADLSKARVEGADFSTSQLDEGALESAFGNLDTKLPSNMQSPDHWKWERRKSPAGLPKTGNELRRRDSA